MKSLEELNAELDADLREYFNATLAKFNLTNKQLERLWLFYAADRSENEKIASVAAMPDGLQEPAMALLGYEPEEPDPPVFKPEFD